LNYNSLDPKENLSKAQLWHCNLCFILEHLRSASSI